ncbi:MAG: hypothetical protein JWM31_2740 [Solirubrobacterales bacterium]|nr:hypothetical protein [Solirubrobacterales bacterium]
MEELVVTFAADLSAPARARDLVRKWATGCEEHAITDLVIATNEIICDSIQHSPAGAPITIHLMPRGDVVLISVTDHGPTRIFSARDARNLRILALDHIASDWGVSFAPTRVWFEAPCHWSSPEEDPDPSQQNEKTAASRSPERRARRGSAA